MSKPFHFITFYSTSCGSLSFLRHTRRFFDFVWLDYPRAGVVPCHQDGNPAYNLFDHPDSQMNHWTCRVLLMLIYDFLKQVPVQVLNGTKQIFLPETIWFWMNRICLTANILLLKGKMGFYQRFLFEVMNETQESHFFS